MNKQIPKPPIIVEETVEEKSESKSGSLSYTGEENIPNSRGRQMVVKSSSSKMGMTQILIIIIVAVALSSVVMYQFTSGNFSTLDKNVKEVLAKASASSDKIAVESKRIDNIINTQGELARKSDLTNFLTKGEANTYAAKSDLNNYQPKGDLSSYATKTLLDQYSTIAQTDAKIATLNITKKIDDAVAALNITTSDNLNYSGVQVVLSQSATDSTMYYIQVESDISARYVAYLRLIYRIPVVVSTTTLFPNNIVSDNVTANFYTSLSSPSRVYLPRFTYDGQYKVYEINFYTSAFDLVAGEIENFNLPITGLPASLNNHELYIEIIRSKSGTTTTTGGI